jgi:hypothetical protein
MESTDLINNSNRDVDANVVDISEDWRKSQIRVLTENNRVSIKRNKQKSWFFIVLMALCTSFNATLVIRHIIENKIDITFGVAAFAMILCILALYVHYLILKLTYELERSNNIMISELEKTEV